VTLDLEDGVLPSRKEEARGLVREAIHLASGGGAEVFVRVNKPYLEADLDACVISGLSGIALPKVEAPEDVETLSLLLDGLERARGMEPGSTRVILLLESARGVWNVRKIVKASPRVSQWPYCRVASPSTWASTLPTISTRTSMHAAGWSSRGLPQVSSRSAAPTL
jgi:citrate lyase subunit beta/citryl-CoA lyase